jgi:hypothetical protein
MRDTKFIPHTVKTVLNHVTRSDNNHVLQTLVALEMGNPDTT